MPRADASGRLPDCPAQVLTVLAGQVYFGSRVHELRTLLGVLLHPVGRRLLAGLAPPWSDASIEQLQSALQDMRTSRLALRQQAYHALRDLTNAAYFADPQTWPALGYPGPRAL